MPADAVIPVHDATTPLPDEVRTMEAVEEETMLPAESSTFTAGCVVRGDCDAPATGSVVNTSCVAGPGPVGLKEVLGNDVTPPPEAVNV